MKSAILVYDELIDWLGQTCREIEGDERPQTQISRCRDHGGAQQRRCHRMAAALWCCVKPAKKGESREASLGGISPAQTELDRFPHAGQRSSVGRLKNSLLQCRELMHKDRLQFLFIKDTRFFLSFFAHHLEASS